MKRARPTILLGGFMGAGKSTVGRLVAARAGVPFVDLDEAIEARAGRAIADLFATGGEAAFRGLEEEELGRVLAEGGPRVVALGGGTLLKAAARRDALDRAVVVTLTAGPETLTERLAGGARPLLDTASDRPGRMRELLAARAGAYAEAHHRIPTDGLAPDAVATAVLEAWATPTVAVPLGTRSYAVTLAADAPARVAALLAGLRPTSVFLITDETVGPLWGARLEETLRARDLAPRRIVVLPPGEEAKRLGSLERALAAMLDAGADRGAVVVTLGGGSVSDLGGFAAATLLRGVRWIAVPTTLLAMIDASVGGKTGIDLGQAKNAVGAFHQPSGVVIGPGYVATETARAYASGLAEVVKTACLGDPGLFDLLERETAGVLGRDEALVEEIVLRSVAVKAAIVSRDEREAGERALLNFGHTVGHALEAEGGFSRLTHGEAVALGMVAMLHAGRRLGVTAPALAARVERLLADLGLPTDLRAQPVAAALPLLRLDKKRRGGTLEVVLLGEMGRAFTRTIDPGALAGLLLEEAPARGDPPEFA